MKYVINYNNYIKNNQLHENFSYNEKLGISKESIDKALSIIQKKMPYQKFVSYIKKYEKYIKWLVDNFTNGKNIVYTDKVNAYLSKNEGFKDTMIYDLFVGTFIDNGVFGKIMGSLIWIVSFFTGFLLYLLGVLLYLNIFYTPMDRGIVQDNKFVPAHTIYVNNIIYVGKTTIIQLIPINVPDTWVLSVKELNNDDVEKWETTSYKSGNKNIGDTISWDKSIYTVTKGR